MWKSLQGIKKIQTENNELAINGLEEQNEIIAPSNGLLNAESTSNETLKETSNETLKETSNETNSLDHVLLHDSMKHVHVS